MKNNNIAMIVVGSFLLLLIWRINAATCSIPDPDNINPCSSKTAGGGNCTRVASLKCSGKVYSEYCSPPGIVELVQIHGWDLSCKPTQIETDCCTEVTKSPCETVTKYNCETVSNGSCYYKVTASGDVKIVNAGAEGGIQNPLETCRRTQVGLPDSIGTYTDVNSDC